MEEEVEGGGAEVGECCEEAVVLGLLVSVDQLGVSGDLSGFGEAGLGSSVGMRLRVWIGRSYLVLEIHCAKRVEEL